MSQDPYAAYGALHEQHFEAGPAAAAPKCIIKPPRFGRQRMKMNIVAIFVSLFVPWILFTSLYADLSFRLHYKIPVLCWVFLVLGVLLVLAIGSCAGFNVLLMVRGSPSYQPTWSIFLFLTSLVAVVLGPTLGSENFWNYMQPYYDLQNLNDYTGVDPTRMRGQQMMDAGRVKFQNGAAIDLRKAYAFQNLETYCVAPITINNEKMGGLVPLSSYDFWAVGVNCCGGNSTSSVNFKCGAYNNKDAQEGLRLMNDESRSFLRLAVQQAESVHNIVATHPLFFEWTENANDDMNHYMEVAFRNFACAMCSFFAAQLCLVFIVAYCLSKTGYSNL
jgi:hypothetical protein